MRPHTYLCNLVAQLSHKHRLFAHKNCGRSQNNDKQVQKDSYYCRTYRFHNQEKHTMARPQYHQRAPTHHNTSNSLFVPLLAVLVVMIRAAEHTVESSSSSTWLESSHRELKRKRRPVVKVEISTAPDASTFEEFIDESKDILGVDARHHRIFNITWDGLFGGEPETPLFVSLTEYKSQSKRKRAQKKLRKDKKAQEALENIDTEATFPLTTEGFTNVRNRRYNLKNIAKTQGDVLEVLVRNTSSYANFTMEDFLATRNNAFRILETYDEAVVANYVWDVSDDPDLDVTFTVFKSLQAYFDLLFPGGSVSDEDRAELRKYVFEYPPIYGIFGVEV